MTMNMWQWRALTLLIGLLLDALLGDPEGWPHPVRLMGAWIAFFERFLKAHTRRHRLAALLLTGTTVAGTMLAAALALWLARRVQAAVAFALACIIAWQCVSARCLAAEASGVVRALQRSLADGRRQVARIVGRDTTELTREDVLRATIETIAENTTDGVIAPMLYFLLGGPVLALGFKASSTLDSMVGYLNEAHRDIGWSSAKLDDVLCFVPARICGILLCVSASLCGCDGKNAFRVMKRDHANHLSPNCAWSEAAVAGALHIRLGGAHRYFGQWVVKPTIGDDERPPEEKDVSRTNRMMAVTAALFMCIAGLAAGLVTSMM